MRIPLNPYDREGSIPSAIERALVLVELYGQGAKLLKGFLRDFDLLSWLKGVAQEGGMDQFIRGAEEVWRRRMVALIREAGTLIRKEEVKRQALSASLNLEEAQRVRAEIEKDAKSLLPVGLFDDVVGDELSRRIGEHLQRIVLALPAMPALLSQIQAHVSSLNDLVQVHNRIMDDLAKQGLYMAPAPPVSVPTDLVAAAVILPRALETSSRVVGTLKGVAEASEGA